MWRYIWTRIKLGRGVYAGALLVTGCSLLASGATAPRASAEVKATVPVVRCRTEFVPGNPPAILTKIAVDGNPLSVSGLAAYTNYDTYLIAPAGMACKGEVAEDGGANLIVWHRGEAEPGARSREEGQTLSQESACVGCMYSLACPMFPFLADRIYLDFRSS